MKKPLALVGLPGSGKTFWGEKIASHHGISFYDLDALVCKQTGLTIAKIFEELGEAAFRQIESETLQQLLENPLHESFVLALGGGTPAFHNNMTLVNERCTTIYLNSTIEKIKQHFQKDKDQHRPLVKNVSDSQLHSFLTKLLSEREAYYKMADYMLYENEYSLPNFEKIIQDTL